MKISRNVAIAVVSSLLAASSFAEGGVRVALRLESNGELLGTPVLIAKFGERAAIQSRGDGDNYRIEMVAQGGGVVADISFKIYIDEGEGLKLVGEPRLVSQFDTKSAIAADMSKSGSSVRLSVEASRAEVPAAK